MHEFVDAERLGQVVVTAGHESLDAIVLTSASRQEEHRNKPVRLAQAATHLEPLEPGEHDVEHDEVEVGLHRTVQAVSTIRALGHLVALVAQRRCHDVTDRGVVFDNEDRTRS